MNVGEVNLNDRHIGGGDGIAQSAKREKAPREARKMLYSKPRAGKASRGARFLDLETDSTERDEKTALNQAALIETQQIFLLLD